MLSPLGIALVVGLALLLVIAIRRSGKNELEQRLSRLEAKLDLLMQNAGVSYDPSQSVSGEVIRLIRAGQTIGAVKKHRELTGAGLKAAKDTIDEVRRYLNIQGD